MNTALKNFQLLLSWCKFHIICDGCGTLGGQSTRGKEFLCSDCARHHQP